MTTVVSSVLLFTTTLLLLLLLLLVPQAGAQTQWVASSSSGAANTSDECQYTNTTIAFIVDTSMSTDDVSGVMTEALHYVGDNNGAVLNFADYMLATWNFLPNDVKHFPTIQDLTTAFDQPPHISGFPNPLAMVGNIRTLYPLGNPFQPNNDWGYMIDSLVVAVQNAQPNGIIIVLGDQDELCDGRQRLGPEFSQFGFNNTARNALIDPLIIAVAQSKNVRISFYYFILANWQLDPNGCSPDPASLTGRAGPMLTVQRIANQTGGTAVFGFDLSVQMASEIKVAGKRTAVCDKDCVPDPSLGVVVDTSGSIQRIKPQTAALFVQLKKVSLSGLMRPFNSYWLSTFANPANAPVSFPTFPDMAAAMQLDATYANLREPSDPQQDTRSNDWMYLIQSLEVMVNKVGAGGYVVVITDQEGMCDLMRFPDKIYSDIMQHIINVAIFKRISFSFYAFADGVDGKHPATQDCDVTKRKPAADKMAATSSILNGEAVFDIDASTPNGLKAASLRITAGIVHQSLRVPCNNCTVNATLALVIDTSASVEDGLKSKLRDFIHELAVVEGGGWFSGFKGGFLLNTWAYLSTQLQHFASLAAMDVFAQTTVPVDPMWARRNDLEPPSNHDDWLYMIRTLNTTVPVIGKDGFIVVIGDDNQLCDADFVFHHTAGEFASIVTLAQQKRVKISLYYFATHNHYCTHMQQVPGQVLVKQIAMQTGGEYFFESDENNWWSDLTEEIIPDIKVEGARPVCPQLCPPGSVWNGVFCMHVDPCDVRPCQHGGTCHGEAYTQDFWCECPPEFYGAHCQYPCVPHSTPSNVSHALGAVIDTSDSAAYLIDSMVAAIHQMTLVTGYFDEYLLSTWEYVDPPVPHMVKSYLQVLAFMAEMDVTGGARGNKRLLQDSGLAQRNDWKYMLDSVEKILPLMGQNGVLLVLADHEQICDANKVARMVNGVPRYPMNPDHPRVLALNVLAKALHIKIFFFVFPSSDKGWCDYAEKQVGYNEALALVAGTGGLVMDMPGYIAPDTLQSVRDSLISTVSLEGQVGRCECPRTTVLTNNLCACPQGKTMNADGFCV